MPPPSPPIPTGPPDQAASIPPASLSAFLDAVAAKVSSSDVFGPVIVRNNEHRLAAPAKASAAPAAYRVEWRDGRLWVSLVTADRWLSQSIEQDLVHTGDKLEDLLDEELTDLAPAFPAAAHNSARVKQRPVFEHFRSEDLLFTFRSPLPIDSSGRLDSALAIETAALWLLGYEATFRRLGDMEAGDDE